MRVGFVGAGRMGSGMAGRLVAAGHQVRLYNRTPEKSLPLIARGAIAVSSPRQAAEDAEAVVVMVADDAAAELVWRCAADVRAQT